MASSDEEFVDLVGVDDYYAWLGLHKSATKEDINNAFRKMSRIYHPDKHTSDDMKEKAVILFNKIKKAHEVLSDPQKRAIYDTTGIKGLETDGWQLVPRTRTPQEILEEFERLSKEREERRLQQRTNPKGTISLGVDATDIFDQYTLDDTHQSLPNLEVNEMSISQSVECPLTVKDTVTLSGNLSSHNGNGQGTLSVACRRILSQAGWAELEMAVGSGTVFTLRGFRTLWRRGYGTMSGSVQLTPDGGIRPGCNFMVAHQLDKNLQGRLTFNGGMASGINAMLIYDQDKHHLILGCQLGLPNCFAVLHYSHKFTKIDTKVKTTLRVGTFGALFEYGCEKKITQFSYLGATVSIGVPVGVSVKIRLNRGSQTFIFPIRLSESISPSAIFYGTFIPLAAYFLVKKLIIDPHVAEMKEKDLQQKKEANMQRFADKKREALAANDLMKEMVDKVCEVEESRGGLLIREALYGKLDMEHPGTECIEVARPLQALVKDSKLILSEGTQLGELPGFYDPCFGEEKTLAITYEFRRKKFTCRFKDGDRILLPNSDHLVTNGIPTTSESS